VDTFVGLSDDSNNNGNDMRIALFGPPGAGKGTQAALLVRNFGVKTISTGDLIRTAIRDETSLGRIADSYVSSGDLVPDELVRDLANEAISENGFRNFILDGYPRTLRQASWLREFLSAYGAPLHAVVSIDVPDDVIVDRLSRRRIHRKTGETYHLDHRPPPPGMDPDLIIRRSDDEPDKIRRRLETYRRDTKPLESHFREQGLLVEVAGLGGVEDVHARILDALPVAAQMESVS
jgi:adenylate kinase